MMIKLFLITLLCATLVFADSPVQNFEDEKPVNGFPSTFMDHGSSLVRRSAEPPPQPPQGGGRGGGEASGGMGFGASMGGGGGAGAGGK